VRVRARRLAALLLALSCALGLCACAGEQPETEKLSVRACICGPVASLDPTFCPDGLEQSLLFALFENLFRLSDDGEGHAVPVPGIAKDYRETVNFDGTVDYAFTLRSSARWTDGQRVKAQDFVYAWRRLVNPETDSPHHALLSMVKGYEEARESGDLAALAVRAESDTLLRVTLSEPCPYFIDEVCSAAETMPLRSDLVTNAPQDWASGEELVGNGPYEVVSRTPQELVLRRSGNYYESRLVGPDELRFALLTDAAEALRLYESGELDYLALLPEGSVPAGENTLSLPLRSTCCVLYNHMSELFSDAHLRRAFDLAIDRVSVASAAGAAAEPATAYVPYGVPEPDGGTDFRTSGGELCAVDEAGYAARCERAREELALAEEKEATPELLYVEADGTAPAALSVQSMWREVLGLTVTLTPLTRADFDARVDAGEYELAIDTLREACGDAEAYLERFGGTDGNNELHYASNVYDLLLGAARASERDTARTAFLHDAEALLFEDAALSPLHFGAALRLMDEGLHGVYHDARGNVFFMSAGRGGAAEP